MNRVRKYIAIVLLEILLFPIISQPVHVLWHHADPLANNHSHDVEFLTINSEVQESGFLLDSIIHEPENGACPIMDYHFPLNEFSGVFAFSSILPLVPHVFIPLALHKACLSEVFIKIPRAPPAV